MEFKYLHREKLKIIEIPMIPKSSKFLNFFFNLSINRIKLALISKIVLQLPMTKYAVAALIDHYRQSSRHLAKKIFAQKVYADNSDASNRLMSLDINKKLTRR